MFCVTIPHVHLSIMRSEEKRSLCDKKQLIDMFKNSVWAFALYRNS